ncbi:MAG: hypothetical protein WCJ64_23350, partial [Rhodospirillaceae bacterium]
MGPPAGFAFTVEEPEGGARADHQSGELKDACVWDFDLADENGHLREIGEQASVWKIIPEEREGDRRQDQS